MIETATCGSAKEAVKYNSLISKVPDTVPSDVYDSKKEIKAKTDVSSKPTLESLTLAEYPFHVGESLMTQRVKPSHNINYDKVKFVVNKYKDRFYLQIGDSKYLDLKNGWSKQQIEYDLPLRLHIVGPGALNIKAHSLAELIEAFENKK